MVKQNFSGQKILKLGAQHRSILCFCCGNIKPLVITTSPLCRLCESSAVLRVDNRGHGGVNNKHITKMQAVFCTVRYVMDMLELVQKTTFFLGMHTARVIKLDHTLYFTLLTACKLGSQSRSRSPQSRMQSWNTIGTVWLVVGIAILCATIINTVTADKYEGTHNIIQFGFSSSRR